MFSNTTFFYWYDITLYFSTLAHNLRNRYGYWTVKLC